MTVPSQLRRRTVGVSLADLVIEFNDPNVGTLVVVLVEVVLIVEDCIAYLISGQCVASTGTERYSSPPC